MHSIFCESFFFFFSCCIKIYLKYLQGFTMNGKPVLNNFLKVAGTFELTAGATVQSPPTILIHIKLKSIPYISHFTETREGLIEFYHNTNQLHIMEMPFNITNSRVAGN